MRMKRMIAGLLAGVLMMGSFSTVCLAAANDPGSVSGNTAQSDMAAPAETDKANAEESAGIGLPEGFTLGTEIILPEGVTIGEDGSISISIGDWGSLIAGEDTGDAEDIEGDMETEDVTEPELEPVSTGTVNVRSDSYLHLRTGPGMEYQIIGHLLRGTEVEVVGEDGDWYQVVVPEASGYVYKDYLDVVTQDIPAMDLDMGGIGDSFDENALLMMLLLMGSMGGMDAAEPPSTALTPDGNLTLVDDYAENYEDGSGKQFITLVSKDGNTFYLVIDRDDEGEQTVHFMNLVDERDLLSLMDEEEAAEFAPAEEPEEPEPPAEPEPDPDEEEPEEPEKKSNPAPVLILLLALLGGGGFFAYKKFFKGGLKKEQPKPDPDADYSDEDDEDYGLPMEDDTGFDADDDEPV